MIVASAGGAKASIPTPASLGANAYRLRCDELNRKAPKVPQAIAVS
jgi:hypothetical protein